MFSGLLEAAKALVGAAGTLQRLGDDRRAKLATYYAAKISDVAGASPSESEVNRLVATLNTAQHSRTMLFIAQLPDDEFYGTYAEQIQDRAGAFRGLANTLRAK